MILQVNSAADYRGLQVNITQSPAQVHSGVLEQHVVWECLVLTITFKTLPEVSDTLGLELNTCCSLQQTGIFVWLHLRGPCSLAPLKD